MRSRVNRTKKNDESKVKYCPCCGTNEITETSVQKGYIFAECTKCKEKFRCMKS